MPYPGTRCKYCDSVMHDAGSNVWKSGSCVVCVRKIAELIKDMDDPIEQGAPCPE